jgi:hypothetical protein
VQNRILRETSYKRDSTHACRGVLDVASVYTLVKHDAQASQESLITDYIKSHRTVCRGDDLGLFEQTSWIASRIAFSTAESVVPQGIYGRRPDQLQLGVFIM